MAKHAADDGGGLRVVLVRPAETGFSRQGRIAGDVDVPLTERGRSDSRRLMESVLRPLGGVDAVYTAENRAARETAAILAEADSFRIRVLPTLNGVSFGLWEGQLAVDVRQRHPRMYERWRRDPVALTPPEGEEIEGAAGRVRSALRTIGKKHRAGTVAVVAPRTVISLVYCEIADVPAGRVFEIEDELGQAEVVEVADLR